MNISARSERDAIGDDSKFSGLHRVHLCIFTGLLIALDCIAKPAGSLLAWRVDINNVAGTPSAREG